MTEQWWLQAECWNRHADPDLFALTTDRVQEQPAESIDAAAVRHAHALRYCDACPVQLQCLTDALEYGDTGVRGGHVRAGDSGQGMRTRNERSANATRRARAKLAKMQGAAA